MVAILANLGVIAGIMLLALELNQNNEMLEAQIRAERTTARLRPPEFLGNNPHISQAMRKGREGETLTGMERSALNNFYNYTLISWEYLWKEYDAGLLATEDLGIAGRKRLFHAFPGLPERWLIIQDLYHPGFVNWMEENVVNGP